MHSPVRHRKSSFFSLEEYSTNIRGRHTKPNLKGTFLVTHSSIPDSSKHPTTAEIETRHKNHVTQNTYELNPKSLFCPAIVEKILKEKLEFLETVNYHADTARVISNDLANAIRVQVKPLFPRYKLVVHVTIGGKGHQGIKVASKCFWDVERDNFASYTVTSRDLFAVATVYGVYFEWLQLLTFVVVYSS